MFVCVTKLKKMFALVFPISLMNESCEIEINLSGVLQNPQDLVGLNELCEMCG